MRKYSIAVVVLCVLLVLAGRGACVVSAEEESTANTFSGSVEMLKQEDDGYVMRVTVENRGQDFYGTAQVVFMSAYGYGNCAYDTEISLPAQGKKQFTVKVAERAADTIEGICSLNFLDEKGRLIQSITLKNVFGNLVSGIAVGILSDDYTGLTHMDAGGLELNISRDDYPLNLIRLDGDKLDQYLKGLYFLIIDQFNVSTLREEQIQAIQKWVENGGGLLIGTGAYGEQTLSGFEENFLGIEFQGISEPGEENIVSDNISRYNYYHSYTDEEIDFSQMAVARLQYTPTGNEYESSRNPAVYRSVGDGAAAVYFCSLGDKELQKLDKYTVRYQYEELMNQAGSFKANNRKSAMESMGQRLLALIDNRNTMVDFSMLKWLIGIYVVLVGPVLYLVLRKRGKSEWYWVGAPALGLLFIAGVYLLGQGARVSEARVYSVTTQRVDSNQKETYFLAYHSGVRPWEIQLAESYDVAGPGWNGYDGKYFHDVSDYFYRVGNTGERLVVGIKPQENFESGFLYAGGGAEPRGELSGTQIEVDTGTGGISGRVTNGTDCDLAYMAVWLDQEIMVLNDVKAGESIDLQQATVNGRCVYQSDSVKNIQDMLYGDLISIYGHRGLMSEDYQEDDMGALLIGLGVAMEAVPKGGDYAVITGVVKDYERAVADRCQETSYGCLYGYAETGV